MRILEIETTSSWDPRNFKGGGAGVARPYDCRIRGPACILRGNVLVDVHGIYYYIHEITHAGVLVAVMMSIGIEL